MAPEWEAELTVTPELAKELIEKQFPELAPVRVESLGDGWDNTGHLVNDRFMFRFPRREIAVEGISIENNVLPRIAPLLPLAIPVPVYIGKPSNGYGWPFSGYSIIKGETACKVNLSREERVEMAEPLARFLKALHGITAEEAASYGAAPDKFRKLDLSRRVPQVHKFLDELERDKRIDNAGELREFVKKTAINPSSSRIGMVHGDFYARHLIVDENRKLAGIIDWGDVHIGNPAADILIAHSFLPPEGRGIFRETYGEIDEENWRLSKFAALMISLILLTYAYGIDDRDLQQEFHQALEFVVDEKN